MEQSNYKMPPEWAVQEAVWMTWPKAPLTFDPVDILPEVERSYALCIKHLQEHQCVKLLVDDEEERKRVGAFLAKNGCVAKNIEFIIKKTEDVWVRDYGPTFITNGSGGKRAIKWIYNGYGKYEDLARDTRVFEAGILDSSTGIVNAGIVLEGGSIEVNGAGICLTTRQCLLNKNRNPTLTQDEIEGHLKKFLGISKILWLDEGIVGDDTDGHIDDVARFVDETTIVYVREEDEEDPNFEITCEIEENLKKMTDIHGNPFRLVPLPMPRMIYREGVPLPASYANFYIGNKVVLVPTFDDVHDQKALHVLQSFFKDRKVVGIPARAWVHGLGTIHCSTQQEPK